MLVRDHYGDGGISGGTLVERVDIGTGGLDVRLRVDGLGGLAREMLVVDIGAAA